MKTTTKALDIAPFEFRDGRLMLLDQTKLPADEVYIEIQSKEDMWDAIYELKVRGAPAIGVAAAYGLYVAAAEYDESGSAEGFIANAEKIAEYLESARPTAVNLSWALERMLRNGYSHPLQRRNHRHLKIRNLSRPYTFRTGERIWL